MPLPIAQYDWRYSVVALTASPQAVLPASTNRVAIKWASNGKGNTLVTTNGAPVTNEGFGIPDATDVHIWDWSEYGSSLCAQWFAYDPLGIAVLTILELVYLG